MIFFGLFLYEHLFLVGKRTIERQLRRLKKADASTGLQSESGIKLDLYFQHFASQQMHTSLESVLKQVLGDIKVLSGPPPIPKPAPAPQPSVAIMQRPSPQAGPPPGMAPGGLVRTAPIHQPQIQRPAPPPTQPKIGKSSF